jgi:thioredoxin reductase (NADPH)
VFVLAALLLASHRSYQPGPLLAAHSQLVADCSGCHQPWRGATNERCIACHGKLPSTNKHTRIDASDPDIGRIAGTSLVLFSGQLGCFSCHSEHQGRDVDVARTAATACVFCHEHPAIEKVAEHRASTLLRPYTDPRVFPQPFNHLQHKLLLTSSYPPRAFTCTACHLVKPADLHGAEQMSLLWSGCTGSLCHAAPQGGFLNLPESLGPAPYTIPYSSVVKVRHINAVFVHSAGHLQTACENCHTGAADSKDPDDDEARVVSMCFSCHAHQPEPAASRPLQNAAWLVPSAQAAPPPAERRLVACGDCHLFHTHGVVPLHDFPATAPQFPPGARRWMLTVNLPTITMARAPLLKVTWYPHHLEPWWLGGVTIFAMALVLAGYIATLEPAPLPEAVSGVAPQRGHQFPVLDDTYQSSVPRLYVVGEAAGTASINLAMRSGKQVVQAVLADFQHANYTRYPDLYDVAIVGCGPSGMAATATAKTTGLRYLTLEKLTPAATLRSYPRAKFVQATPIDIEEYGSFFLEGDNSREQLIEEWEKIIAQMGLTINEREEVVEVAPEQDYFRLRTRRGNMFKARFVILAIGVRGNPRRLGLPGETPDRVHYNLIEPSEFTGRNILVVGGGNAGAEVAQALAAAELGNRISYSFRSPVLTNVTPENANKIAQLRTTGRLQVYPSTAVAQINPTTVTLNSTLERPDAPVELDNEVIFAMLGADLPAGFFQSIGVKLAPRGR